MKVLAQLDSLDNVIDGETRKLVTKATSSGSGNVVSSVSVSGDTVTYTKGVTALTAHQNAFSNVKVGSTTVAADSAGDTLELAAGSNITLTPDATNDKVTIAASQPTVNNGTLTIQKNGTNVQTFSANQSGNATANITVPTKTSDLTNDSNYITNTGSTSGNAGTATRLQTARTIGLGTAVNSTATSFDGSSNITIPVTSVKEAYLTWGGQNIAGAVSPLDAAISDEFSANRLAYLPASTITVEYSRDGGSTWVDYGATDSAKINLVTTGSSYYTGGTSSAEGGNYQLRVTIAPGNNLYMATRKLFLYISTQGVQNAKVDIDRLPMGSSEYVSIASAVTITGWSGWNSIPISFTYGGSATWSNSHLRLTFYYNGKSENYPNAQLLVQKIRLHGETAWSVPSTMAQYGRLYDIGSDKSASFPGDLYTTGTLTANNLSAKKAIINTTKLPISAGKISGIAANNTYIGSDGIGMSNPGTTNDAGWLRMLGTGENDSVLELAVGDDGSGAAGSASNEEVVVRKYNTSNTVSKEIKLFDKDNNSSFPGSITATGGFIGDLTGNASTATSATTATKATGDKNGNDITTTYYKASNPNGYTSNTGTITGVSVNGTSVATSGVANITSMPASILSGAIPSAVTATTQSASDNSTKIATTAFVQTAIDNLPEPMVFKGTLGTGGTITALPVDGSANIGDTYKVITAGTYASKAAKVGDTFICLTKTSSANTWELIPSGDEPSGTVTSITIKGSSPITIDSESAITTSGTRTISHANSGVTAGTYRSVTVNATGHVTAGTNPTTLSGYGITDAKIASGVITLGSNTITPLTASSTLDATKVSGTLPTSTYTDTKNTAGSTDSSSKLFLIGATSQAANPQTYSQDTAYVGTDGHLYSNSVQVVNLSGSQALTNKTYNGYTLAAACAKAVVTSIDTSASLPTSNAVKTFVEGKGYVTTDTKNTAGSTDTSSKIFLIGATSQAANPQTYSDNEIYATSGVLTTKSVQVGGTAATMQYNSTDKCIEFVFA